MIKDITLQVTPEEAFTPSLLKLAIARAIFEKHSDIQDYRVVRRSIDARGGIRYNISAQVAVGEELPLPNSFFLKKMW